VFYGTDLDLQLGGRGVKTMVLGRIATNCGVESTARQTWEYGYHFVIADDAATSSFAELPAFSINEIQPRIGIDSRAADIVFTADRSSIRL
jgi:nicotinamidase-related amidase